MTTPVVDNSSPASDDVTYEVLTESQWRLHEIDIAAAFAQKGLKKKIDALTQVYRHSRVGRAFNRYTFQRGKVLAGGISYMALFSMAAAITVVWTVFAHLFASNPHFQETAVQTLNSLLPGIMEDTAHDKEGLLDPNSVGIARTSLVMGIIAFGVALFSASRVVRYISDGIRAMFGLLPFPQSVIGTYSRFFLGFGLLTLAVVANAILSVLFNWLHGILADLFPLIRWLQDSIALDLVSTIAPIVANFVIFPLFIRYVAAIRVPRRTLLYGSAAFALASGLLSAVGSKVVGSTDDPIVAAAATAGTLLVWINVVARIALMICAWMANPPAVIAKVRPQDINAKEVPNYVTLSDPKTLEWPFHPISGDLIPSLPASQVNLDEPAEDQVSASLNPLTPMPQLGPNTVEWTSMFTEEEIKAQQVAHDRAALGQTKKGRQQLKAEKRADKADRASKADKTAAEQSELETENEPKNDNPENNDSE